MTDLAHALTQRFCDPPRPAADLARSESLARMAARGSCRAFTGDPVPDQTLRTLAAIALAAPSKSDLQQRDILLIQDPAVRADLKALLDGQDWIADAPTIVVFLANNRRQRWLHRRWDRPFANDHADALFNASVDAGIALMAFLAAAETIGLGGCPISTIRNRPDEVSALFGLPRHVFAVAGLALGTPAHAAPRITPRLPLSLTVHTDRFDEGDLAASISAYDAARPLRTIRRPDLFGPADPYSWSDDKTRQYAQPERVGFGAFLRRIGFCLD